MHHPELPPFDETDLIRWFNARDLDRSDAYLGAVRLLQVNAGHVVATVQGTARQPYAVHIQLGQTRAGKPHLSAQCSCPVGWFCKHCAAVLRIVAGAKPGPHSPAVNPEVLRWLDELRHNLTEPRTAKRGAKTSPEALFYLLEPHYDGAWAVVFAKGRLGTDGHPRVLKDWNNVERALLQPPAFTRDEDLAILRLLWAGRSGGHAYREYPLHGELGEDVLTRMLATGRLIATAPPHLPLAAGAPLEAELTWVRTPTGHTEARIVAPGHTVDVLDLGDPWYVDSASRQVGRLHLPYSGHLATRMLTLPPLADADLAAVADTLAELAPELPPPAARELRTIDCDPKPILTLDTLPVYGVHRYRDYPTHTGLFDYARLSYDYDGIAVGADSASEFALDANGETVRVRRRPTSEQLLRDALGKLGLIQANSNHLFPYGDMPRGPIYGLASEAHWPAFMAGAVPELKRAGWRIVVAPGFRHNLVEVEAWEADIAEREDGWLSLDMGIVVEGDRLPLAPLLYQLFRRDPRWLDADRLKRIDDATSVELALPSGTRVRVPAARLKPIARTLIDLFDGPPGDGIKVSRLDAPRLIELADTGDWQVRGGDAVRDLASRLRGLSGVRALAPPAGLALELRPYQREGLAWLQYLREQDLAGILADDMGLGKTAQTLAHLLLEKEAGRMDRPSLVVLPTSLVFNWKQEAERFAPGLKVLSLHGKERAERFPDIASHDVCLTTYPLLWRDAEILSGHEYHFLILDEAQTVKNAASQAAQAVRRLRARHRLCLTGTPLENHLGELWAQFDFLLPGFLSDSKSFARTWRTPIEKHGDPIRRDLLAARLRPFILRRRKEDVAKELPAKTVIVRPVELEGGQRDLYETVRSAMDARVREEIAAKGFNRSQIVILDALLKLRQVCCDPRLLKLDAAKRVKERAKLDQLMDMLPELVEEGRKVLVFSQFASMLALIEEALTKAKLPFITLTGATTDREGVIRRFQAGDVPVFLISLKAGGVGLNLTAADTVIHYDPWWNPAAENQATDRAHRIGQTRNVFVYKLVVSGSIEERILALQEKKAELAAGVLSEDGAALSKFGESDIRALLAPLPGAK